MAAFERCVVRNGLQATTLEEVAKEAELPRSLVRHFVGNRDDMVAALGERFLRRVEALWRGMMSRPMDELLEFLVKEGFVGGGVGRLASELRYERHFDENAEARFTGVFRQAEQFMDRFLKENGFTVRAERREKGFVLLALAYGTQSMIAFGLPKSRADFSIRACKRLLES
jgi:AcrR family transcriptional regulator